MPLRLMHRPIRAGYTPDPTCPVCNHPKRLEIDEWMGNMNASGITGLSSVTRAYNGDFSGTELHYHLMEHLTEPIPAPDRKSYYDTDAYLAKHPAAPPAEEKPIVLVRVYARPVDGPEGGHPIVFFEQDPAHPNGEAFIAADGKVVEVATTPKVEAALRAQMLLLAA
jgi:hypothetical protein